MSAFLLTWLSGIPPAVFGIVIWSQISGAAGLRHSSSSELLVGSVLATWLLVCGVASTVAGCELSITPPERMRSRLTHLRRGMIAALILTLGLGGLALMAHVGATFGSDALSAARLFFSASAIVPAAIAAVALSVARRQRRLITDRDTPPDLPRTGWRDLGEPLRFEA